MNETIVDSSGNIFIDLGYSPDEAAILQMRADLMADLRKFIRNKKLTQAKASEILGVSQSRVSDLTRGKWERLESRNAHYPRYKSRNARHPEDGRVGRSKAPGRHYKEHGLRLESITPVLTRVMKKMVGAEGVEPSTSTASR